MVHAPRRSLLVLSAVIAVLAALLVASPAQAATGSITGTIYAKPTGGTAVKFGANGASAIVYKTDADGFGNTYVGSYSTNSSGTFTATGLADGYYHVRVFDDRSVSDAQRLGSEYYDNGWSPYDAALITISGGKSVALANIVLERTGSVVGTVRDGAGQPIANASVSFRSSDSSGGYGLSTDAQGRYDTRTQDLTKTLIPGRYLVSVNTYGGIDEPAYASTETAVTVTADGVATLDVTLTRLSTRTFTVKTSDGKPVTNAPVILSVRRDGVWGPAQYGPNCTDAQGRYRVQQYGDTAYRLFFGPADDTACEDGSAQTPSPAGTVGEYWNNVYALEDATVIDFSGAQSDLSYTVTLGSAPTIKHGTVSITGTFEVGQTLTAASTAWTPSTVELGYQWSADGADIPGATQKTLALTSDLQDKFIGVRVTGRLAGEKSVDQEAWATGRVAPKIVAVKPTISGTAKSGSTLTATAGTWKPTGVSLSYQWLANGTAISGATAKTFKLTNTQAGKKISVKVTGKKSGSRSASSTSAQTATVAGVLTSKKPTISGTAKSGKTLTASVAAWTPSPVTLKYQWLRNGTAISGATARTYKLTSASVGKKISVRVTGTKTSYTTKTSTSSSTATVVR